MRSQKDSLLKVGSSKSLPRPTPSLKLCFVCMYIYFVCVCVCACVCMRSCVRVYVYASSNHLKSDVLLSAELHKAPCNDNIGHHHYPTHHPYYFFSFFTCRHTDLFACLTRGQICNCFHVIVIPP